MPKQVRTPRRWFKWIDLLLWLAGIALVSYYAYRSEGPPEWTTWIPTKKEHSPPAVLRPRELLYLAAPLLTFGFTVLTHYFDDWLGGGGISQRGREIERLHDLKSDAITGTMTKQSVLVALASIFIVFVQQDRGTGETDYSAVVRWVASAGFLISIFLMLISVKTYDYASRFQWEEHPSHAGGGQADCRFRIKLVGKAFTLDIIAFYFLLFTAIVATGLIERWFPIPASLVCGLLLWTSYFFLREEEEDPLADLRPHSVTLHVHDVGSTAQWFKSKLKFSDGQSAGLVEKNGFVVEIIKVEASSTQGVAGFSFQVDDADKVKAALTAAGAEDAGSATTETAKRQNFKVGDGLILVLVQKLKKKSA